MAVAGTLKTLLVKLGVDSAGYERDLTKAEKRAKKFELVLKGAFAAAALAAAKFAIDSTKLAARVETLDVVVNQLGKTANYTASELDEYEESIKSQGITTKNTLQSMSQMVQANIDLAEGSDLARIAQNNAVIANINSSEAFKRLVTVLQTGNTEMARTMGLNLNFAGSTKRLATELDKTVEQLSAQEVMQARLNEVKKAGVAIEGAYEAAMGTAGKTVLSLDRQIEEISLTVGRAFLPVFTDAVGVVYDLAKGINAGIDTEEKFQEAMNQLGYEVDRGSRGMIIGAEHIDEYGNAVDLTKLEVIKLAEAQMLLAKEMVEANPVISTHEDIMLGLVSSTDLAATAAAALAEAERSVALALGDVTQAELATTALDTLNEAWATTEMSEEDYKSMYTDIATNISGLEQPAIDAQLRLFDLEKQMATDTITTGGFIQEVTDLGIQIGALPDYKKITIEQLIITKGLEGMYQRGGSFTVPPGFPDDSYAVGLTSGEQVQVTPAGGAQDNRDQSRHLFEGAQMNFNRPMDEEVLLEQIRRIAS